MSGLNQENYTQDMVRTENGALVSTNDTKYLQRKNTKLARKQSMDIDQRIVSLERQVARLQIVVENLQPPKNKEV